MSLLGERLISVHQSLDAAGLPHAFGGAIALAYCTVEPRGTRDVDVNVFIEKHRADEALDALPPEVGVSAAARDEARRRGQVRLFWDEMPLDLFLDDHEFQREAAGRIRRAPFEGTKVPILACDDLARFKALYDRPRDWADVQEMLDAGSIDGRAVLEDLGRVLGLDHPSVVRLWGLLG